MIELFRGLYQRYFSEQEAIIFSLLLVIFFSVLWTIGSIIAPLLWSLVLAYLLQGMVNALERLRMPHHLAVYLVYCLFLGVTFLSLLVFLPFSFNRLAGLVNDLPKMMDQLRNLVLLLPQNYPDVFSVEQVQRWFNVLQNGLMSWGQALLSQSMSSFPRLITWMVYTVLVPILVFFMLKDSKKLLIWFTNWLPERRPIMAQVWQEMNDQLSNYIRGKALQIVIVGVVAFALFALMGLNYALLLAVLVALSIIVPYVGVTAVSVPVLLVAFFQWGFSADLYQFVIAFLILHALDGNLLVPLIFSETVNLHPIAIIASVLVFGGLWGFWGVFFAIPLATFIKAVIHAWPISQTAEELVAARGESTQS
ncbi:MAG: AI-2E family transporter [Pseudomonadales bacterium]|jgi:putative permease|nr:AI-2E family transporter [Pseudomonadales bacterium]